MTTLNLSPATRQFLRSLYASLGLAAACLTYAEWPFLPQTAVLAALTGGLMAVAYVLEGRWALSLRAANVVGGVIAVATVAWLVQQFQRGGTLMEQLPMPAAMLPYLGPFVLVLIPAKLLRPKHDGDYWWMQLIGLMTVALASALASDAVMGALVFAYVLVAVRCLTDFHAARLVRDEPAARPLPGAPVWLSVILWVTLGAGVAALAAGVTPRVSDAPWEFSGLSTQFQQGISDERPAIDLNLSGEVVPSNEVAFHVRAENRDGSPKLDLAPESRWRGATFNEYEHGKWGSRSPPRSRPPGAPLVPPRGNPMQIREALGKMQRPPNQLPDLGPASFSVIFRWPLPPRRVFYLIDPVWPPRPGGPTGGPVVTETASGRRQVWEASPEGDLLIPRLRQDPADVVYRQYTAPTPEPNVGAAMAVDPAFVSALKVVSGLPGLQRYANELLRNLADAGKLPGVQLPSPVEDLNPRYHEAVARAFSEYFRSSGQFAYTLNLTRVDPDLDPIEDFVLNVRAGHCNRFSSALALLLRCQGIPCRMVLGYLGAESLGDGTYVVRQGGAHSWVEALIERPGPGGASTWHWLTLDPTPGDDDRSAGGDLSLGEWLQSLRQSASELFRSYVLDLNRERQAQLRAWVFGERASDWVTQPRRAAVALTAALSLVAWAWPRRRSRAATASDTPFVQFRELLRRSRLVRPRTSQTGPELLSDLALALTNRTGADAVLGPAGRIVAAHERTRFGGEPADADRQAADLKELGGALRHAAEASH
jgi:transglutaminase-like putative cysteine protease